MKEFKTERAMIIAMVMTRGCHENKQYYVSEGTIHWDFTSLTTFYPDRQFNVHNFCLVLFTAQWKVLTV